MCSWRALDIRWHLQCLTFFFILRQGSLYVALADLELYVDQASFNSQDTHTHTHTLCLYLHVLGLKVCNIIPSSPVLVDFEKGFKLSSLILSTFCSSGTL